MATVLKVLCFASFLTMGFCASLVCPTQHMMKPCHCTRTAFGMQVVCSNFNKSADLIKVLHGLKDYKVHTILLRELNMNDVLPSDLFDGVEVKEIKIQKSTLKFSQPAFSGLDSSLFVLDVAQHSMISSKDMFPLAKLTKLSELYVQSNGLKTVEDKWLNEKVPNVVKVTLDENEITEVGKYAFYNLRSLTEVSMSGNKIEVIERTMFSRPAFKLEMIDLSYNKIHSLPEDIFQDMPLLSRIKLTENKLQTLPQATWTPVWEQLYQVLLFDNQIDCGDKMNWIKKYRQKTSEELQGSCVFPDNMKGTSIRDAYKT